MRVKERRLTRPLRAVFFGWWVVAGGWALEALNAGFLMHAFGAYFVHLQGEFGWNRTALSGAAALIRVEAGILGPVQGWLIDRFGTRFVLRVGLVVFAIGLILFSFINSIAALYAAFLVIAVGSSFSGFHTIHVAIANWFRRKRGTAMGLTSTGLGMGGLLAPAVAWSMGAYGWRTTAMWSALIVLLVGIPVVHFLVRDRPEQYGLSPDGGPPRQREESQGQAIAHTPRPKVDEVGVDFTVRETLHSPAFWLIGVGHASALLVVAAVNVHLIPYLVARMDMSVEKASLVLGSMTVLTITGQLGGGFLGDRLDKRVLAAVAMTGHCLGMLALAFATTMPMVFAFAVLHGLAWGVRGPLMSTIRADYFGRAHLGTILGYSSMISMVGHFTGPVLVGFLADRSGGNYQVGFTILAVLAGIGTLFFALARKPAPPARLAPSITEPRVAR